MAINLVYELTMSSSYNEAHYSKSTIKIVWPRMESDIKRSKYGTGLKQLLLQYLTKPEFYGDLVNKVIQL